MPARSDVDYLPPLGSAVVPPASGIVVPQSPSGTSTISTGRTSMATSILVDAVVQSVQQGVALIGNSSAPTIVAGIDKAAISNYRWW